MEPEPSADIAAAYVIGPRGEPRRVGVAMAIASRLPALGPELLLDAELPRIEGRMRALRKGGEVSASLFSAGDVSLHLVLAAVEPDHFEAADYRRAGDAHVHLFGERLFGFERIPAEVGDEIEIQIDGLGSALGVTLEAKQAEKRRVAATPL
jgi:hypothetical protein